MYRFSKLKRGITAAASLGVCMVAGTAVTAETADLSRVGSEYRFLPALIGDQLRPNISFGADGGYMVTHDNSIDGNGFGIRARRFYADLSGSRFTFQVNSEHAGNQQDARVAMLSDGGGGFRLARQHCSGAANLRPCFESGWNVHRAGDSGE